MVKKDAKTAIPAIVIAISLTMRTSISTKKTSQIIVREKYLQLITILS